MSTTTTTSEDIWTVSSKAYCEPDDDGIPHGTRNGYQYHQCRGARCRAAHTKYCVEQRAIKRARSQRRPTSA